MLLLLLSGCLLVAPLCGAVLVKTPGDIVQGGGTPTYRLWGKVYNSSYTTPAAPPGEGEDDVTIQPPESSTEAEYSSTTTTIEGATQVQVECVDTEPLVWKGMLNCLRKRRFISCMSGFISRHWSRVATATGRKKALRRFYLPMLLLFFKFKLLVVVLGMVAALAGKSAIMSVVSLAVAAGVAIKTSLGVHDYHNNKRFDGADLGGGQTSSPAAGTFNAGSGLYVK